MNKILFLLVVAVFVASCSDDKRKQTTLVETCALYKDGLADQPYTFSGMVITDIILDLKFNTEGTIKNIFYDEGDYVVKDQLIAELDDEMILEAAERVLEKLNNATEYADSKLKAVEETQKALEKQEDKLSRIEDMVYAGRADMKSYGQAEAILEKYEEKLSNAETEKRLAFDEVGRLRDLFLRAKEEYRGTKIVAPDDGYVIFRRVNKLEKVKTFNTAFVFSFGNDLLVTTCLSNDKIDLLLKEQRVVVQTSSFFGTSYYGKIENIGSSDDQIGNGTPVDFRILDADNNIRPGMEVKIGHFGK